MAQQAHRDTDERLNELSDRDGLWGPLVSFRPAQNRLFSGRRALALAASAGGFYGMLLNLALALICRRSHHLPPVYAVPLVLTFTYFVGFQFTLGPAWNRRARLLVRRAGYLRSLGRTSDELR
jgi:hypothetical protein